MAPNEETSSSSSSPSDNHHADDDATNNIKDEDLLFTQRILREARETAKEEPELCSLLHNTVLAKWVNTFEDAVTATVCYRMLLQSSSQSAEAFCPHALKGIFQAAFADEEFLELGNSMKEAVRRDAQAVIDRDPACDTLLEVVLFYKGFSALVVHRAAHQKWNLTNNAKNGSNAARRSMTALFLQSQASAIFGLDIHPGSQIGAGILLDHGTGIVIGETATIGDGCTLLHGVTLGGTGKESGDRHPKVGRNVLIGAGASVLGNIRIGNRVKIGAGSIVLRPLPAGATAVGAPAKIIGKTLESNPAATMDESLEKVGHFLNSESTITLATTASTVSTTTSNGFSAAKSVNDDTSNSSLSKERTEGSTSTTTSAAINDEVNEDACVCPFRDYAKFANRIAKQMLPGRKGCITFCQFSRYLSALKCPKSEMMAAFFALDQRNAGYLKPDDLTPDLVTKALVETTALDSGQIGTFLQKIN